MHMRYYVQDIHIIYISYFLALAYTSISFMYIPLYFIQDHPTSHTNKSHLKGPEVLGERPFIQATPKPKLSLGRFCWPKRGGYTRDWCSYLWNKKGVTWRCFIFHSTMKMFFFDFFPKLMEIGESWEKNSGGSLIWPNSTQAQRFWQTATTCCMHWAMLGLAPLQVWPSSPLDILNGGWRLVTYRQDGFFAASSRATCRLSTWVLWCSMMETKNIIFFWRVCDSNMNKTVAFAACFWWDSCRDHKTTFLDLTTSPSPSTFPANITGHFTYFYTSLHPQNIGYHLLFLLCPRKKYPQVTIPCNTSPASCFSNFGALLCKAWTVGIDVHLALGISDWWNGKEWRDCFFSKKAYRYR